MKSHKYYDNQIGILGWLFAGRYGIERYLYAIQRCTGIGLIIFLLMHLAESSMRIRGEQTWTDTMAFLHHPLFKFFEWVLMVGFLFHAINGLRLIISEFGFGMGKPTQPIYPYPNSLDNQRPLTYVFLGIFGFFSFISFLDFFVL